MKQITESDRIAAMRIAKRLVAELGKMEWHRRGDEAECARRVSEAVNREARNSGLNQLLIKSCMLRIQRGLIYLLIFQSLGVSINPYNQSQGYEA